MYQPTHLDLFSGIGGFALAAEWAGFKTVGFCEIKKYCQKQLRQHWKEVPIYPDVRTIPIIACDLLTGGFPCQPFSIAGRRLGQADDRNLWPAMLEAIKRCRPAWIVGENVVNATRMVLSRCFDDLEKAGYQSQAFDIPACAVGLQTLERHVWIVASRVGVGLERGAKTILPKESQQRAVQYQRRSIQPDVEGERRRWHLSSARNVRSRKGVPNYVDRIEGLGNAIPPKVAYPILKGIYDLIQAEKEINEKL